MEKYKLITDNIYDHYHGVITRAGLGLGVKFPKLFEKRGSISIKEFLVMATEGVKILRSKDRKFYDSLLGAIFGMGISLHFPSKKILLAEPENDSYDLTILMINKGNEPKFKTIDTHWFMKENVIKLEITELRDASDTGFKELRKNKLSNKHDYQGRVLLVSIDTSGKIELEQFSKILKEYNYNFKNVWLIGRASLDENKYLLAELLKQPLLREEFIIDLDFSKIKQEIKRIANYDS